MTGMSGRRADRGRRPEGQCGYGQRLTHKALFGRAFSIAVLKYHNSSRYPQVRRAVNLPFVIPRQAAQPRGPRDPAARASANLPGAPLFRHSLPEQIAFGAAGSRGSLRAPGMTKEAIAALQVNLPPSLRFRPTRCFPSPSPVRQRPEPDGGRGGSSIGATRRWGGRRIHVLDGGGPWSSDEARAMESPGVLAEVDGWPLLARRALLDRGLLTSA